MATIIDGPKGNFVAHPEGNYMAVMRDTYLKERPNPWKGTANDKGVIDTRDIITELIMEFLTDHEVEVDGKKLPGFVRFAATASLAENAKLRKFIGAWFPQLKEADFKRFDADKLIGRGAYITVKQNISKKGDVFANVIAAAQPPKGVALPIIPKDFVRHQDKQGQVTNDPVERYDTVDSIRQGKSADIGGDMAVIEGPKQPFAPNTEEDQPF